MAVYKRDIADINLETGNIHRTFLNHSIGLKDQKADHFGVRVFRDGEPVNLSGVSVQGVFMPPQGSPIAITSGNIVSGNVAEVVLPQACYNYDGQFCLAIKLVDATNSVTGTVRIVDGMVDNTHASGTVAPTSAVPTYQEVLSVYEQAIAAISTVNAMAGKMAVDITAGAEATSNNSFKDLGNRWMTFRRGYYSTPSAGSTSSYTDDVNYVYALVACAPGDVLHAHGYGDGTSKSAWAFLDSSLKILDKGGSGNYEGATDPAPTSTAFALVNVKLASLGSGYYGWTGPEAIKDQISTLKDAVSEDGNIIYSRDLKSAFDTFKGTMESLSENNVPISAETFLYTAEPSLTETYISNGVQLSFTNTANPAVYYALNNLIIGHKYKLVYNIASGSLSASGNQKIGTMSGTTFTSIPTVATIENNVVTLEFTATSATHAIQISMIYSSKNVTLTDFKVIDLFIPSVTIPIIEEEISDLHNDINGLKYISIEEIPINTETFLYATIESMTETYIDNGVILAFTETANPIVYYRMNGLIPGHKYILTYIIESGALGLIGNQAVGNLSGTTWTGIPTVATLNNGLVSLEFTAVENVHDFRIVMVYSSKNVTLVDFTLYDKFDISDLTGTDVSVHLPEKYFAVVGDTFELFYKGIINCINPDLYYVEITCPKGNAYQHKFIYTPIIGDVGNIPFTINVYDQDHNWLAGGSTTIVVKQKATSPASEKVVLWVGDSLSVAGVAPSEFYRRLTGSGGTPVADGLSNITMIGTRSGTSGAKYVAEGGRQFNSYNTADSSNAVMLITTTHDKTQADQHSIYKDSNNKQWKLETIEEGTIKIIRVSDSGTLPSTGTLTWVSGGENHSNIVYTASQQAPGNPFWNASTGKVDFKSFVTAQGENTLDYVFVLLGWNSMDVAKATYKTQVETFINNVQDATTGFPNCKVILLGLEIPSLDGLGNNYEAKARFSYYFNMSGVWRMEDVYKEVASENAKVTYTQVSGQFDTLHNMQTGTRAVNTRNSETEVYQTNGVHPANSGYLQIADVAYREMVVNELQ